MKALLLPPSSSSSSGFHPDAFASQQQPGAGTGPLCGGMLSQELAGGSWGAELWRLCHRLAEGALRHGGVIHPEQGRKLVFLLWRIHLKNPEAACALLQNSANPFLKLYRIQ